LTVTQVRELLGDLKAALEEFAAAEDKLNRDFRAKTEAAEKRHHSDLEQLNAELSTALAAEDSRFEAARAALLSRGEARQTRIVRAHKSAQKSATRRIDDEEGRWKYQSQKGLLDTKRWRTDSLAENDATLAAFQQRLAENRGLFVNLEQEAATAFRGYSAFRKLLSGEGVTPNVDASADEHRLLEQLGTLHATASAELNRFRALFLPKLFRALPLWLWVVLFLVLGAATPLLLRQAGVRFPPVMTGAIAGGLLGAVVSLYLSGRKQSGALASAIATHLENARRLHNAAAEKAQAGHEAEIERIEREARERTEFHQHNWNNAVEEAERKRAQWPSHVESKWRHVEQHHGRLHASRVAALEQHHAQAVERMRAETASRKEQLASAHRAALARFQSAHDAQWQQLEADWRARTAPMRERIDAATAAAQQQFPEWKPDLWANWQPPHAFTNAARFARLELDVKRFADETPEGARLAFPGGTAVSLPLVLTYPQQGSVLFETPRGGNERVIAALNNIIFRLLATTPVGKLSFTIIDPVKLGQNFSAITHLADFEENLINGRIWTQTSQIEEKLGELNEHMEKVIQMYLRNEYETIAEYNLQAGNIAEKYHFVVVADFPANFSDTAVRRLLRIAASGARCGVFTLIHWDHRHVAPPDFLPEELRKASVCISATESGQFLLAYPTLPRAQVVLDAPPVGEFATDFLQRVGEANRGSNRVEVPFAQVAPPESEIWSVRTAEELRVPIGRSGATKLQYLSIGQGTRQHALIAGKTGSGKSTLLHVIITNLALWCSPEEVEFYLVDFKKGVEFKSYAAHRLPHAKVVAIESDREFGLSVLQRLDDELKRRGELFRKLGVQDVPGYKRAGGSEPMPRALLMIDEFQEFFVEDDRIAQAANLLLDRIVRQGRAFGIHCILGSQTLGGAYTLARTTIGQMVIRIALQTNEADAYLIMDESNPAPRLLSRPGEGIYNDMAGMVEGNSPFQAVWIDEGERDARLNRVRALTDEQFAGRYPGPIVFEGNAPADARENPLLAALLGRPATNIPDAARVWLGAPNSIKGPTEAVFQKRSGSNLLVVGQREEPVLAMLSLALVALGGQFPKAAARFVVLESTAPGSPERDWLQRVAQSLGHDVVMAKAGDVAEVVNGLAEELQRRLENESAAVPRTFVFVHGLQNFKKLKPEDEFAFSSDGANLATQLQRLITEGPTVGLHVFATVDTYNNVNRFLGRKLLSEFEMRVLFQMSANDSSSLCDDPKASTLGLHRALFYNEQEGYLETFRPYAMPDAAWLLRQG
jgi:DNA segregation ATPase FtsK/SpoIIIE, S-DNA-T family